MLNSRFRFSFHLLPKSTVDCFQVLNVKPLSGSPGVRPSATACFVHFSSPVSAKICLLANAGTERVCACKFSTKPVYPDNYPYPFLRIESESDAKRLVYYLNKSEREILFKTLDDYMKSNGTQSGQSAVTTLTREQIRAIFSFNLLPFIGFGILDNLLMIIAGEYIDHTLGVLLALSTMAAAGLGNILSDVAGVCSAHYVEFLVTAKFGVKVPQLTPEQWASGKVRWTINGARCVGLIVGCLIGMFPLLFFDEKQILEKKASGDSKSVQKTQETPKS